MSQRIEISTSEDLDKIRENPYGEFVLVDDINIGRWRDKFHAYLPERVKNKFNFYNVSPIGNFGGEIHGNGHKIKNIRISTVFMIQ